MPVGRPVLLLKKLYSLALANGLGRMPLGDVEVCRTGEPPDPYCMGQLQGWPERTVLPSVLISLSHNREHAVAFALATREGG